MARLGDPGIFRSMNAANSDGHRSAAQEAALENPFDIDDGPEGLKQRSLRGSFVTVLSQATKMAIQLGSQIILARLLFPAEFGLLAMAYPVLAFVQVFNDIGLGQAIIQRPTLVPAQVSALFWVNLAISCVLACAVALLSPVASWVYGEPQLVGILLALSVTLPIAAASISPAALLARQMRFGVMARNEVIAMMAGASTAILCAWSGLSYWSLVIGQFANVVTTNILVWLSSSWRPTAPVFNTAVWNDVKFGGNLTLSNLATFVTTMGANVVVGLTTGKVSLGLYDRSYNLVVRPIGQMMAPLSRVAVPLLSRLAHQDDEYRTTYLQIFRIAVLLVVPGMLVCIANAPALIDILLGARWREAAPIFAWICVGGLTSSIYLSAYWLFVSQGRAEELRNFSITAAVINLSSYVLGSWWGVIGIVMASSLGFVFINTPLMLYRASKSGPVGLADLVRCGVPFVAAGLVVFAVLWLGVARLGLHGVVQIAVATFLSYSLFVALSLFSPSNRRLLQAGLRSLKGLLPA